MAEDLAQGPVSYPRIGGAARPFARVAVVKVDGFKWHMAWHMAWHAAFNFSKFETHTYISIHVQTCIACTCST